MHGPYTYAEWQALRMSHDLGTVVPMYKTRNLVLVLTTMAEDPDLTRDWYAYDLARQLGIPAPSVTRILGRMARAGWLVSRREPLDEAQGRPPRRLYRFNPDLTRHPRSLLEG